MSSLVEIAVLEPLAMAPGISLTTKRQLARLNRVARDAVYKHLYGPRLCVHEEDCTAENAFFVNKWLDVVPDAVLCVHGVEGELELGKARQTAKLGEDTHFGGEEHPLGPLYANPTAAYFLGHALALTWSRFRVDGGKWVCTVNNSVTVMNGVAEDYATMPPVQKALFAGPRFHNALLHTENRALDGNYVILRGELLKRLPGGSEKAAARYNTLRPFVGQEVGLGRVLLDHLQLNDDDMAFIAPRVRARRGDATSLKMRGNAFGMAGAAALFAEPRPVAIKPAWPRLKHIDFAGTPIGPDGYPQLCGAMTAKHMPQLQSLNLENTGMGDIGARLVFNALGCLPTLHMLDLSRNPFGAEGLKPLERKASSRNRVVVAGLKELHMLAMPGMNKPAWQFLGRTIMGGCFPKLEQLFATAAQGQFTAAAAEPAKLAVEAVRKGREATKATAAAVAALSTPGAKKRANKRAKKA
jgi:hypothetical protein